MNNEDAMHVRRRTVVTAAAWAAPIVALTVATPMAAASVTTPDLGIELGTNPLTIVRGAQGVQTNVALVNNGAETFTGAITVNVTGMTPVPTLLAIVLSYSGGWTPGGGSAYGTYSMTWTGTLAAGASSDPIALHIEGGSNLPANGARNLTLTASPSLGAPQPLTVIWQ